MAAKKKTDLSYSEGSAELEAILDEIESGQADIDVLYDPVARAAALINFCKDKLLGTELRVNKVVEQLASDDEDA